MDYKKILSKRDIDYIRQCGYASKVDAIKTIRKATGCGLLEALEIFDAVMGDV